MLIKYENIALVAVVINKNVCLVSGRTDVSSRGGNKNKRFWSKRLGEV